MAVIILHPSDELKLVSLQKELISELFEDGRIFVAEKPLWIPANAVNTVNAANAVITVVELGDLEISEASIFIPVTITSGNAQYTSKLTLVSLYRGRKFTGFDRQIIAKIKQPVKQLKVFRLGLEKELSSNSKCIIDSKWIKLHNTTTTVE